MISSTVLAMAWGTFRDRWMGTAAAAAAGVVHVLVAVQKDSTPNKLAGWLAG